MTAANPDAPREFYGPAPTAAPTDPALDPPCTIRVQGGQDRATRYSPHALRAVRTSFPTNWPWLLVAGPPTPGRLHLTDDEVADWPVMPAVFATVPWKRAPARVEPAGPLVGDMDVEAFRG